MESKPIEGNHCICIFIKLSDKYVENKDKYRPYVMYFLILKFSNDIPDQD